MREVETITRSWCEPCHQEGERTAADVAYTVTLDPGERVRSGPRLLDLCHAHEDLYIAPLRRLLRTLPPQQPAPTAQRSRPPVRRPLGRLAAGYLACPLCRAKLQRASLVTHMEGVHKIKPIRQPDRCPDCSLTAPTASAMASHRRKLHGWDMLDEYARAGRAAGITR